MGSLVMSCDLKKFFAPEVNSNILQCLIFEQVFDGTKFQISSE